MGGKVNLFDYLFEIILYPTHIGGEVPVRSAKYWSCYWYLILLFPHGILYVLKVRFRSLYVLEMIAKYLVYGIDQTCIFPANHNYRHDIAIEIIFVPYLLCEK